MNPFDKFHLIDLTHPLHERVPTWSGGCGFHLDIKMDYPQGVRVNSIKSHAGVGTHMDAPSHFIKDSWNIADIPLESCLVPVSVIHLKGTPDLFITPHDLEAFEKEHGRIPPRSLFLAHSGWDQFWNDSMSYRNPDAEGRMHFPGFSEESAKWLIKRDVVGIGIDTLSPDGSINGAGVKYPVHELILGAKKYILENVANLGNMPSTGAFAIALPPRVRQATESAIRLVGLTPK